MDVVVAVLQLKSSLAIDNFTFAEGTVCFWNIKVALRRRECFLEAHCKEAWNRDDALLVLETQKHVVIFRAEFSCLQFFHQLLVFVVVLAWIIATEGWLPVFVRSLSHQKLVL